jgi:hypothetical protein
MVLIFPFAVASANIVTVLVPVLLNLNTGEALLSVNGVALENVLAPVNVCAILIPAKVNVAAGNVTV